MMKAMKQGLAAAALLAVCAAAAPEAAAYKQVCMRGQTGFGIIHKHRVGWGFGEDFATAHEEGPDYAEGMTNWTKGVYLGEKECISLGPVPTGAHFVVQLWTPPGKVFCHGWRYALGNGKPKVGIFVKNPANRWKTLMLKSWADACIPWRVEE